MLDKHPDAAAAGELAAMQSRTTLISYNAGLLGNDAPVYVGEKYEGNAPSCASIAWQLLAHTVWTVEHVFA